MYNFWRKLTHVTLLSFPRSLRISIHFSFSPSQCLSLSPCLANSFSLALNYYPASMHARLRSAPQARRTQCPIPRRQCIWNELYLQSHSTPFNSIQPPYWTLPYYTARLHALQGDSRADEVPTEQHAAPKITFLLALVYFLPLCSTFIDLCFEW